jgi:hypothetical protein
MEQVGGVAASGELSGDKVAACRGFDLSVAADGEVWWAALTPIANPGTALARSGRGDTPEAAAQRARERYEQEQ